MTEPRHRQRFQPSLGAVPQLEHRPAAPPVAPVVFEPPFPLASAPEVWIGLAGGHAGWGGAQVFVSDDDDDYRYTGQLSPEMTVGRLVTALPRGAALGWDAAADVEIDLVGDRDLPAVSEAATMRRVGACHLGDGAGGEVICYSTTRFMGNPTAGWSRYALTGGMVRGAYGTGRLESWDVRGWGPGTALVRCDATVYRWAYEARHVGRVVWFKIAAMNEYAEGQQELDEADTIPYPITGRWHVRDMRRWL